MAGGATAALPGSWVTSCLSVPELMQGQQNASMLEGSSFLLKDVSGLISFLLLCSERCSRKNFEDQFGEQN